MSTPPAGTARLEELLRSLHDVLPPELPSLSGVHPELAASNPGAGAFFAMGRRAAVEAGATAVAFAIRVDGRVLVPAVRPTGGRVANTLVSPGTARREWVGDAGLFTEAVLAFPTHPLVWAQWESVGDRLPEVELALGAGGGGGPPDLRTGPGERALAWPNPDGTLSVIVASGGRLRIDRDGAHAVLEADPAAGRVTLLGAAGTPDEIRGALRAAAHVAGHALRAGRGPDEGITLATGVGALDEAVEWARARVAAHAWQLAHRPRSGSTGDRGDPLLLGLAALAAGEVAGARALSERTAPDDPVRALLAARIAATSGDAGPAQAAAAALAGGPPSENPLWAPTLPALADALRYAAPADTIARLREMATASRGAPPPPPGPDAGTPVGRRLPMASSPGGAARPPAVVEAWPGTPLADLLVGDVASFRDDPEAAWADWRARLAAGLDRGPSGPGTWDPARHEGTAAARLVLELVHGLLGIAPDAPVGRIRIAPRFPPHLRTFAARGIAAGDARLRLEFRVDGATWRFRVEPEAGSVPPLLVLEPLVPGRVRSARIDGSAAALEPRRVASGTIVPVQLPVDGPRELEVELEGPGSAEG